MITRALAVVSLLAAVGLTPALAQTAAGPDTKMMIFRLRADRSAAFEAVVVELIHALQDSPQAGVTALQGRVRVLRQDTPPGASTVEYVLLVEDPSPDVEYSLERLIRTFLPQRSDELLRDLEFATERTPPSLVDLRPLASYAPTDALRRRLERFLGEQAGPAPLEIGRASGAPATAHALDRLRGLLWNVAGPDVTVVDGSGAWRRVDWRLSLRNLSLDRELNADVVVEFRDGGGAVIDSAGTFQTVPVQDTREMSGQVRLAAADAARIASATVRVEPR